MIIKSHIRGGYRAAADYLKDIGANEETRLVQISDPHAINLDEAFQNMWAVACNSKCKKPLHHISINPFKDERLKDEEVLKIVTCAEQKYGYKPGDHQRVIVEHIKDGRQHFHVMWNRVSLKTGKAVWPGEHWKKSKQTAREMEKELGLKRPTPKRFKHVFSKNVYAGSSSYRNIRRHQKQSQRSDPNNKGSKGSNSNKGFKKGKGSQNRTTDTWRMSKIGHPATRSLPSSSTPSAKSWITFSTPAVFHPITPGPNGRPDTSKNITSAQKFIFCFPDSTSTKSRWIFTLPSFTGSTPRTRLLPQPQYKRGGAGANSHVATPYPAKPSSIPNRKASPEEKREQPNTFMPMRPMNTSGMCEAQRIDFEAACAGKITWAEYYRKWGGGGGPSM